MTWRLENHPFAVMQLSLIGMSGCGKSHWSKKLSESGFKRFCCDDLIRKKLESVLTRGDGTTMGLGQWMGFPYESHYEDREARYLACEVEVLVETFGYLESNKRSTEEDIVIDTTGSVIYTGDEVLKRLQRATTVVHLATPPEIQDKMLEKYLTNKRPVLWRDMFTKKPNEAKEEALARCYPDLLMAREKLYERYSHVTVDYYRHTQVGFGTKDFINSIINV